MAQARGSASKTFMATEASWGDGSLQAGRSALYIPFKTNTLRKSVDMETSEQITASRNPSAPARGAVDVGGDITAELESKAHGLLWYGLLGAKNTTDNLDGTYTHEFWIGSSLPSFVIEKQFTDINQYFKYSGCYIGRMSLSLRPSGFPEVTFSVMGKDESTSSSAFFSSYDTSTPGNTFDNFSATIGEGSGFTTLGSVVELTLEFDNDLDGEAIAIGGQGLRAGIAAGVPKVTGTMRVIFEDLTLYNKAINRTETSLRITLQNGTGDGTAGNEKIQITLPELYLSPQAPPVEGPRGIYVDFPISAFYANETVTGRSTAFHVQLDNTVANYDAF